MSQGSGSTKDDVAAYRAIELIYHSYLTGLILMISSRAGAARAADVVFKTFRRQQLARFVPGLQKLGLDRLPHAVACAQYHYLSNQVGGVKVEYVYESDKKAWVRYPPPRWIWSGTAICGIPSEVSRAMLWGGTPTTASSSAIRDWGSYARARPWTVSPASKAITRSGITTSLPRSACSFRPVSVVLRSGQISPRGSPTMPGPKRGCRKVLRNYAMEYITSIVPETIAVLGPRSGGHLAGAAARLVGMHTFDEVASLLGGVGPGPAGFAAAFAKLAVGQGDDAQLRTEGAIATVRQTSWRLMAEREALSPAVFDAWNELWVGAALAHDRFVGVDVTERRDRGDAYWCWQFR